jgi:hypothetical protein
MKLKVTLVFLALDLVAAAQTSNVPGVTLSGSAVDPIIENHSGKQVIAAMAILVHDDGSKEIHRRWFVNKPNEFSDGTSQEFGAGKHKRLDARPVASANLLAVIFYDGEFRGENGYEFQQDAEQYFASMRQSFAMAKAGNWAGLRARVQSNSPDIFGAKAAFRLAEIHDKGGDINSFAYYGNLPASTWKGTPLARILNSTTGMLAALFNWIQPTAYAQGTITNLVAYDNTSYWCQTWPVGSNPDCPDTGGNTPWVGLYGTCPGSVTVGIKVTLGNDDPYFPQFGMNTSATTTTLKSYGSCQDVLGSQGTPPYNDFEGYSYHITCSNTIVKDYDNTNQICGVSDLRWPG